jgi:(p)ppGpp synthase/HD superfamily hydrolase
MKASPVEQALALCEEVHRTQRDKAGMPYVDHPIRVAGLVETHPGFALLAPTEQEAVLCGAYLHDVIEDSPEQPCGAVTAEDLLEQGFSLVVVEVVVLLTRNSVDGTTDAYYERLRDNPLARMVKLADIADNLNHARQRLLLAQGITPNEAKYLHALEVLALADEEGAWLGTARDVEV